MVKEVINSQVLNISNFRTILHSQLLIQFSIIRTVLNSVLSSQISNQFSGGQSHKYRPILVLQIKSRVSVN
jgi:hypothetical protein